MPYHGTLPLIAVLLVPGGQIAGQIGHNDAEVWIDDLALFNQLFCDNFSRVDGDRKADSDVPLTWIRREDSGVYADDLSVYVCKRAAAVPQVNRSVGLDEVAQLPPLGNHLCSLGCTDDTDGDAIPQREGISDCDGPVAHANLIRITELCYWKVLRVHLYDREVRWFRSADHTRLKALAVREANVDLLRPGYHVVVRQNIAVLADDDAGARTALNPLRHRYGHRKAKEILERIAHRAPAPGMDVYHRRSDLGNSIGDCVLTFPHERWRRTLGQNLHHRSARTRPGTRHVPHMVEDVSTRTEAEHED